MGCGGSSEQDSLYNIEELYTKFNLQQYGTGDYIEEIEKHIFMAINVLRFEPKLFVPVVQQVKDNMQLARKANHTKDLIETLKSTPMLPPIRFDEQANMACRRNNDRVFELNQEIPERGGNIEIYVQMTGRQQFCEEYTMCQFETKVAARFVALQLILDWGREGSDAKTSPLLKPIVNKVGIAVIAHRKAVNVIQCLYIKEDPAPNAHASVVLNGPASVVVVNTGNAYPVL